MVEISWQSARDETFECAAVFGCAQDCVPLYRIFAVDAEKLSQRHVLIADAGADGAPQSSDETRDRIMLWRRIKADRPQSRNLAIVRIRNPRRAEQACQTKIRAEFITQRALLDRRYFGLEQHIEFD